MSNSAPTPPRGSDAGDDGSHFTVEDAGSTTDAADLFHNDTTARDTSSPSSRDDAVASADDVAAAGGSGTSTGGRGTAVAVGSDADRTDAADRRDDSTGTTAASSAGTATGSDAATGTGTDRTDRSSLVDDESIGHVFDQTNGVIEGLDGDSDGSAESDVLSRGERAEDDPVFDDAAVRDDREGVADRRDPSS